jgi:phosphate starvation-inducible PhoH-like protein
MSSNTKTKSRREGASAASSIIVLPELRETKHRGKVFEPLNRSQEAYLAKIETSVITFGIGPAGTGKTFLAAKAAADAFQAKEIDQVLITRPVVEAGERLGFLPGDLNEKYYPYVQPFLEALKRHMGSGQVDALIQHGKIEFSPLAYMRGHSWDRSFVVMDEAQNTTPAQMKLFLTRIGKGTTVVVDGDISQKDETEKVKYRGLEDAIARLESVRGVAVQRFSHHDIVRSGIVKDIICAYSDEPFELEDDSEGVIRFITK